MNKKNKGLNSTVWCGEVVKGLEYSHAIKKSDTEELKYYRFSIKTRVVTNKGKVLDEESILPMVVSETELETLEKPIQINDVVFVRGSWRPYTVSTEGKNKVEQVGFVSQIQHSELRDGKFLNRYDFQGYIVDKLYEPERDSEGKKVRDEATGKFIPKLDENGEKVWTTRVNREGKVVNDFTVAINTSYRSFYILNVAYFGLAKKIAKDIPVGAEVKGSGFIRSRSYKDAQGIDRTVYEAVIVSLDLVENSGETTAEEIVSTNPEMVQVAE